MCGLIEAFLLPFPNANEPSLDGRHLKIRYLCYMELKALLDEKYAEYNQPTFIEEDPIRIPHQFDRKEDIEISGFLSALIAWGRRSMIIQNAERLMERMDWAPHQFVMHANEDELGRLSGFVHRTFNEVDARGLVLSLRSVYEQHGGLNQIFAAGISPDDEDVYHGIIHAREILLSHPKLQGRTHKHVANPAKGSSAKRINMYLRWMVRPNSAGVDFGIWEGISPSQLICPLDVHTGNVARALGLLTRKQNDWKAASELTQNLRAFHPEDPVRYDFSLFALGVYEGVK
ncbi:TIGR02757 family protein [Pontibacter sp. G13]|uniref:TIGR02757 family protein n=1 Tax=Pontibacter sp. G13 TaxID=3074898 RepID=UPI00288A2819|nr:TIGR02757 family protein [Pontibacter sp. G13]WNJ20165.1 TIGR02757 family protein [Pontibacter sp. G13]